MPRIEGRFDAVELVSELCEVIFERFSESKNEGLIFTYVWAFDLAEDREYIRHVADIVAKMIKDGFGL